LVCLVRGYGVSDDVATRLIEAFMAGAPLERVRGSQVVVTRDRDVLLRELAARYGEGEHDVGYTDYSRSHATLLHIHFARGRADDEL